MTEALEEWRPRALSVLRIVAGLMIIEHGMAKLLGWPVVPAFAKLQLLSQLGAAGCIELIGGALVTVGLFTQPVAFILSGEMAVAYFMVHAPRGFYPLLNGGTLAIMYCFAFLYLSTAGAGPWSLDAAMKKSWGATIDTFNKLLAGYEPAGSQYLPHRHRAAAISIRRCEAPEVSGRDHVRKGRAAFAVRRRRHVRIDRRADY